MTVRNENYDHWVVGKLASGVGGDGRWYTRKLAEDERAGSAEAVRNLCECATCGALIDGMDFAAHRQTHPLNERVYLQ